MGIMKDVIEGSGGILKDIGDAGMETASKLWEYKPDYNASDSITGKCYAFCR